MGIRQNILIILAQLKSIIIQTTHLLLIKCSLAMILSRFY